MCIPTRILSYLYISNLIMLRIVMCTTAYGHQTDLKRQTTKQQRKKKNKTTKNKTKQQPETTCT